MSDAPELAIGFIQCDRPEYTRRTLESFVKHASGIRWEGCYADDASKDQPGMMKLAESFGMAPEIINGTRKGCTPTSFELICRLKSKYPPETLVLYLQNDFEFLRPIPFKSIRTVLEEYYGVGWVRLTNRAWPWLKEDPVWIPGVDPQWTETECEGEAYEIGWEHYSCNPPSIMPLGTLYWLWQDGKEEKEIALASLALGKGGARLLDPVTVHIGKDEGMHKPNTGFSDNVSVEGEAHG